VTVARRLTWGLFKVSISSIVRPRRAFILLNDFLACSLIPGESSSGGRKLICNLSPAGLFSFAGEPWYTRLVGDDEGEVLMDKESSFEAKEFGDVASRTLFFVL